MIEPTLLLPARVELDAVPVGRQELVLTDLIKIELAAGTGAYGPNKSRVELDAVPV